MLTTGSIDYRLNEGLQLRQMPVQEFAIVAHMNGIRNASKSKLFEAFRGVKSLQNETAIQLWALWKEIEELCQAINPLALDLSDGSRVHDWLIARRKDTLNIITVGPEDGAPEQQEETRNV